MKLWFDECLTPTLVQRANDRGYWATCNRDRGLLNALDENLHPVVIAEDAVFFTNNESDYVALCRRVDLHTGLVIIPQADSRESQWPLFDAALAYIEERAEARGETPADWIVNKHVWVEEDGTVYSEDLPTS